MGCRPSNNSIIAQTVFLRDLFAGEAKTVVTAAECTTAYPICGLNAPTTGEASVSSPLTSDKADSTIVAPILDQSNGEVTGSEARKFTLEQVGAYKVLTNLAAKRQYVLYPVEAQAPADADLAGVALPAGFQRRTMSVPAQKVSQSLVVVVDRSALRCAMCVCV